MSLSNMISIIVPVYNSEQYLCRCLDSILNQTYRNIEVIVVDDGSTDRSGSICDEYANKDRRVKVSHIYNSGVSHARNYALTQISGDCLMFVDSDDWIDSNMCEEMLSEMIANDADMLVTKARNWDENGNKQVDDLPDFKIRQIDLVNEFSFLDDYALGVVWGTLYSKKCVGNFRFDEDLSVGEDTLFFAKCVKNSKKFLYSEKVYYNYVIYELSAAHGPLTQSKMTNLVAWERVAELFATDAPRISETAKGAYGRQCVYFIKSLNPSDIYYSTCKKGIRKNICYMLKTPKLKTKIDFIGYFISPTVYGKFRKILKK